MSAFVLHLGLNTFCMILADNVMQQEGDIRGSRILLNPLKHKVDGRGFPETSFASAEAPKASAARFINKLQVLLGADAGSGGI